MDPSWRDLFSGFYGKMPVVNPSDAGIWGVLSVRKGYEDIGMTVVVVLLMMTKGNDMLMMMMMLMMVIVLL